MNDKLLQSKLNKLTELANELDGEAKRRYGKSGFLFFEAEGTFFMMAGDADDNMFKRQDFIRARSYGYCKMGAGAW